MMADFDEIILFEKALKEELTPEEQEVFARRLANDQKFKSDYQKFQKTIYYIRQHQHYEDLMVLLNESYKSKDWSTEPIDKKKSGSRSLVLTIIGILIIGAGALVFALVSNSNPGDQREVDLVAEVPEERSMETGSVPVAIPDTSSSVHSETVDEEENASAIGTNPSAFMISQSGYFLTQFEPIREVRFLRLRQNDSTEYKAELVLSDTALDIAVIRITSSWNNNITRLPYRLATTQAFQNTDIMVVGRSEGNVQNKRASITDLEDNGSFNFYDTDLSDAAAYAGGPMISKNGNVVAIVTAQDTSIQVVKSTHLISMLARHAGDAGMADYLPASNNQLAGLERDAQLQRIDPFVLEVIRFY